MGKYKVYFQNFKRQPADKVLWRKTLGYISDFKRKIDFANDEKSKFWSGDYFKRSKRD